MKTERRHGDPDLISFLATKQLLAEESAVWGDGTLPLQVACYLTRELPPLDYVTSVRAVVFRNDEVLTVRDGEDSFHIVPGGRREAGEHLLDTLQREVLEETGWGISAVSVLAVIHYHHLARKPDGYAYPYPDFLQLIYRAQATMFNPEAQRLGEYELETGFRPINDARKMLHERSQRVLLEAALQRRHRR